MAYYQYQMPQFNQPGQVQQPQVGGFQQPTIANQNGSVQTQPATATQTGNNTSFQVTGATTTPSQQSGAAFQEQTDPSMNVQTQPGAPSWQSPQLQSMGWNQNRPPTADEYNQLIQQNRQNSMGYQQVAQNRMAPFQQQQMMSAMAPIFAAMFGGGAPSWAPQMPSWVPQDQSQAYNDWWTGLWQPQVDQRNQLMQQFGDVLSSLFGGGRMMR